MHLHLQDFLREESLEPADDDDNVSEDLDFSETDSEWDEFSDENDTEWEQELLSKPEIKLKEKVSQWHDQLAETFCYLYVVCIVE